MKKELQQKRLRSRAVATKHYAKRYVKAIRNKVTGEKQAKGRVKVDRFCLTDTELAFIQQEIEKGNKNFEKLIGFKTDELNNHSEVRVSLDTAKALIANSLPSTDITTLVTFILNHADFSVSQFIMNVNLSPEVFRDLAILFRKVSKGTSFWLIARAKILRPNGPIISNLFGSIADEYIATLNVGIGVITYNRKDHLAKTVEAIKAFTTGDYELVVADDGSKDDTVEWCGQNNVLHTNCQNKGVVRNKNRALYYLNEVKKVDVLILLEDDCRPNKESWQKECIWCQKSGKLNIQGICSCCGEGRERNKGLNSQKDFEFHSLF